MLRAALLRREVAPGEKLPAERELAVQLGVDRGTLRAGLQRLVAQGLLVQRQGRGTEARDFLDVGGLDLIAQLVRGAAAPAVVGHLADLLLVRRHLAGAVLEALVEAPPSAAHRAAVVARVAVFGALVARRGDGDDVDDDAVAAADIDVLAAVVAATGRPVLRLAFNPVAALFRALPALREAIVADAAASAPAYAALVAWLEAPDHDGADALLALLAARDAATLERLRARATAQKTATVRAARRGGSRR